MKYDFVETVMKVFDPKTRRSYVPRVFDNAYQSISPS